MKAHRALYRPFRKEATDSLDEVAIQTIRDRLEQLRNWINAAKRSVSLWKSANY
jgi:transcriptional accessory protein Tex/SPT6